MTTKLMNPDKLPLTPQATEQPKVKIIATLGPASTTPVQLHNLLQAGVSVFRINAAHTTHSETAQWINHIKQLNKTSQWPASILYDLQGGKIRLGEVAPGTSLQSGTTLTLTPEPRLGNAQQIGISYTKLAEDVQVGTKILLDDGRIVLQVQRIAKPQIHCKVVEGGPLSSHKGLNIPHVKLNTSVLTTRDMEDIAFALKQQVDWIALSFVKDAKALITLRQQLRAHQGRLFTRLMAKIERAEAIHHLEEIIAASDAVMVARGDLGTETSLAHLPLVQKIITQHAHTAGKPVVIATQMMESMCAAPIPTRAEVTDVAQAVLDGADALLLSAETAIGHHPQKVVRYVHDIIDATTRSTPLNGHSPWPIPHTKLDSTTSLAHAACVWQRTSGAKAIVCCTCTDDIALALARYRPQGEILIYADPSAALQGLTLVWGVRVRIAPKAFINTTQHADRISQQLVQDKLLQPGDTFIQVLPSTQHTTGQGGSVTWQQIPY